MLTLDEIRRQKQTGQVTPSVQPRPSMLPTTAAPAPAPAPVTNQITGNEDRGKLFSGGTLSDVMDVLSVPGSAGASFVQGTMRGAKEGKGWGAVKSGWNNIKSGVQNRTNYSDVAAESGVKNKYAKAALGFAGDVVLDPLNFVGVGLLNKIPKFKKAATAAKAALKAEKILPKLGPAGEAVGRALVYRYKQAPEYVQAAEGLVRNIEKGQQTALDVGRSLKYAPEGMTIGNTTYKAGQKLSTAAQQRLAQVMRGGVTTSPTIEKVTTPAKTALTDVWGEMVKAGVVKDSATRFKGQYLPNLYRSIMENAPEAIGNGSKRINDARLTGRKGLAELGQKYLERFPNLQKNVGDKVSVRSLENMGDKFQKELGLVKEAAGPASQAISQESKNAALGNFFKTVEQKFSSNVAQPGWVQLPNADNLKQLAGKYVPQYVHDELVGGGGIFTKKGIVEKFVSRYWKPAKTVLNPAQHARNAISNQILNFITEPKSTLQLPSAIKEMKKGGKYLQEAKDAGVIGRGFAGQEINDLLDLGDGAVKEAGKGLIGAARKVGGKIVGGFNKAVEVGGNIQSKSEDLGKLQQFMTQRKMGKSIEESAKMAEKALFDYGKVTPFEKKLRSTAIPFYTFTRKSLPLLAETAVKHPTRLTAFRKGEQAVESLSSERSGERKLLPSYLKDQVRLPTPKSAIGKKIMGDKPYLSTKFIYPWGNTFDESSLPFGLNVPAIDLAAKVGAGYDPYYEAKLTESPKKSDQVKSRLAATARTLLPSWPLNTFYRANPQLGGMPEFVKSKTDVSSAIGDVTGIKINNLNTTQALKSQQYNIKEITTRYNKAIQEAAAKNDLKKAESLRQEMLGELKKASNQ